MSDYIVVRDAVGDWLVKKSREGPTISIHKSKDHAIRNAEAAARKDGNAIIVEDPESGGCDDSISRIILRGTTSLIKQKRTSVRRRAI